MKYSSCDERNALTFFNMAVLLVLHCDKEKLLRAVSCADFLDIRADRHSHPGQQQVESDLGFRSFLSPVIKVPLFASVRDCSSIPRQ